MLARCPISTPWYGKLWFTPFYTWGIRAWRYSGLVQVHRARGRRSPDCKPGTLCIHCLVSCHLPLSLNLWWRSHWSWGHVPVSESVFTEEALEVLVRAEESMGPQRVGIHWSRDFHWKHSQSHAWTSLWSALWRQRLPEWARWNLGTALFSCELNLSELTLVHLPIALSLT